MYPQPIADTYISPERPLSPLARCFSTVAYYARAFQIVLQAALHTRSGYSQAQWAADSHTFIRGAEACGVRFIIENVRYFAGLPGPCVVVANHMSTLETFSLPYILASHRPISFVLKKSLTTYPLFQHIVNATHPIAVGRVNAREDFGVIMEQGQERLRQGISVVVFPQTTRALTLDRARFNSIGIKLAKKAHVPIIPLALKTNAWGVGTWHKDFGPIYPDIPVHFCFGDPLTITGSGKAEHEAIMEFIDWKLRGWAMS
ncbi:lysophospholipid acyltransferase family protein [Desulfovibrionales bacterium]